MKKILEYRTLEGFFDAAPNNKTRIYTKVLQTKKN